LIDYAVPEAAIDEEAVDEDNRPSLSGLAVADPSRRQFNLVTLV
jgi:hypothetical protein